MSSVRRPVGPLPPHVYWRRRALVLAVLAAIVAVVVLIVVRPGAGNAEPAADASEQPAAPVASDPPAETQQEGAACLPASVKIEPVTDATEYTEGTNPQISMRITNTSAAACTLNAGTTQQVFQITSGSDVVWKSTDCQVDPVDAQVTLEPNAPQSTAPIPWDRTRSDPSTCGGDRPVMPGDGASYHLEVSVGEYAGSATKQFLLY